MLYLDVAATNKYRNVDDIVVNTITTAMRDSWMNPSSLYAANIKEKINKCRENIAEFIGAKADEVYFTSGASESNNWAIRGWVDEILMTNLQAAHVITTPIEHKSLLEAINNGALDARVYHCDVDKYGLVNIDSLEELLIMCENEPILVSVNMANNEIGTWQDISAISDLVHRYGGILHVDATQALPYIPIEVEPLGIDMMSASGHKLSPVLRGIGFLYKKNCINIRPLIYGSQESGLRGGTENTYGILGLNKAIEYCDNSFMRFDKLREKRDYFIDRLETVFNCKLNGHHEFRLPNNINVTFPQNITGESLLYMLDINGIKISVGSACNSKSIAPSHVLKAIGLSDEEAARTIRITISDDIEVESIDQAIDEIEKSIKLITG